MKQQMRFGGEAPRRRAHSPSGIASHRRIRGTALSDRHRQLVVRARASANTLAFRACRRSACWPQHDALRDLAVGRQAPQGDQKLPGEGDDHGRPARAFRPLSPRPVPLREGTILLKSQEAPSELDQTPAHAGIARLANPFSRRLDPLSSGEPVRPA